MVQNNTSKLWNIKGTIVSRREHQGHLSNSYVIKVSRTGRHICRSERHIRAVPTNTDTNGINIGKDDMAHSVFVSSTGYRPRSSLKSSSGGPLSGRENSAGGAVSALNLRAYPCSGSGSMEAGPAPTPTRQPGGSSEGVKMLKFSHVLHVFEESGEDFFDKEALKDLRKSSQTNTCHEDFSKDRERIKEALAKGFYEGEDHSDDEGSREVRGNGRSPQPGGGRCLRPHEACRGLPKYAGLRKN